MGEDLDDILLQFIPRLAKAADALEYHLAVAEMATHVHDGHAVVSSPTITDYLGPAYAPVRLRLIEGLPVVTSYLDEEAAREAGIAVGDVILKVNGVAAKDRMMQLSKYLAASTEQSLMRRAVDSLLRGPDNSTVSVLIRGASNELKEVKLPRKASYIQATATQRTGDPIRLLPGNIGYADLDRITVPMVDSMFEKFKDTKAIIFDDRTYPLGTAWTIAPRLARENGVVGAIFERRISIFPDAPLGEMARQFASQTFFQRIPSTSKWRYKGKTVMLIDERAISQAEHTGLFFEAANGTKFIGSPTGGANGDVTNFCVPGNIWINFSGQAVRHADGRQLQRASAWCRMWRCDRLSTGFVLEETKFWKKPSSTFRSSLHEP